MKRNYTVRNCDDCPNLKEERFFKSFSDAFISFGLYLYYCPRQNVYASETSTLFNNCPLRDCD